MFFNISVSILDICSYLINEVSLNETMNWIKNSILIIFRVLMFQELENKNIC